MEKLWPVRSNREQIVIQNQIMHFLLPCEFDEYVSYYQYLRSVLNITIFDSYGLQTHCSKSDKNKIKTTDRKCKKTYKKLEQNIELSP